MGSGTNSEAARMVADARQIVEFDPQDLAHARAAYRSALGDVRRMENAVRVGDALARTPGRTLILWGRLKAELERAVQDAFDRHRVVCLSLPATAAEEAIRDGELV